MNGRTHALIGLAVPAGALFTGTSLPEVTVLCAVSAAFALGPDIDHPNATVTKALPGGAHRITMEVCGLMWKISATGRDRRDRMFRQGKDCTRRRENAGLHRTFTHTLVASVFAAGMAYAIALLPLGPVALAVLSLLVCGRLLRGRWRSLLYGGALAAAFFAWKISIDPAHLALAAAAGWTSHVLADACTTRGVPLLWPMKIKGKRWWYVRALGGWLHSGDKKEAFAACGVAAAMNLPYFII